MNDEIHCFNGEPFEICNTCKNLFINDLLQHKICLNWGTIKNIPRYYKLNIRGKLMEITCYNYKKD
jgi:hypothetical protein